MTDLYGVRVLAVDPPQRRVRMRVTAVYYDIGSHAPLTDDASFFLRVLRESAYEAPLAGVITQDQYLDEQWVDTHTRWFIESVRRIEARNFPYTPAAERRREESETGFPWEDGNRFDQMSPEAAAKMLAAEEVRVGADYDVVVTDPRWIEHLEAGDWWRTASYPTHADSPLPGEADRVPELRRPVAKLTPFVEDRARHLAFSDDGRFLSVSSEWDGELAVYDTDGWHLRLDARPDEYEYTSPWLMWVPGEPVVTVRHHEGAYPQWAFDPTTGRRAEVPEQTGLVRSPTGRYRVDHAPGEAGESAVALLSPDGGRRVIPVGESEDERRISADVEVAFMEGDLEDDEFEDDENWYVEDPGPVDPYQGVAFAADESRMFVARGTRVYVLDPSDGRTLDVIENDGMKVQVLRVSPGGEYLAIAGVTPGVAEVTIRRVGDHRLVTQHAMCQRGNNAQTADLAWSPDGRRLAVALTLLDRDWKPKGSEIRIFRMGLTAQPPATLRGEGATV